MHKGLIFAVLAGLALSTNTSLVTLGYQNGSSLADIMLVRGVMAMLAVALYCRMAGIALIPSARSTPFIIGTGIGLGVVGVGYLGAVYFISPGLAVACLFTYPAQVLILESIRRRQMPDVLTIVAFGVSFLGIIFSLSIGDTALDWRGIVLGLAAAMAVAITLELIGSATRRGHAFSLLIPAHGISGVAGVVAVLLIGDGFSTVFSIGFGFMALAAAAYALGILLFFVALRFAPAERVALMTSIEPISTLMVAYLLVGEQLGTLQYLGIVLAMGGITLGGMLKGRSAEE